MVMMKEHVHFYNFKKSWSCPLQTHAIMRYIARKHDLCGKVNFLGHTSYWFFKNYSDRRRTRTSRYAGGAEYGLPVRLLFSSYDFRRLTDKPSMQCWSETWISGTDGFDFATPLLQAPTMSLQRKPTWKSNWNQDKHITLESLGHGKLNHHLTLLC